MCPYASFIALCPHCGRLSMVSPKPAPTFDEFVDTAFRTDKQLRNRRWKYVINNLHRHVSPSLGHRRLDEITKQDIERWYVHLRDSGRHTIGTCNAYFTSLKSVFNLALEEGLISRSPCQKVEQLKGAEGPRQVLTQAQAISLKERLEAADDVPGLALTVILASGARKNEVLKATWASVDWERGVLTVPRAKSTGRPRSIYLSQDALAILRRLQEKTGRTPFLCPSPTVPGQPISDIYRYWQNVRSELGLEGLTVHRLRHSFGTFLSLAGVPVEDIQRLLGHSSLKMTNHYLNLRDDVLRADVDLVGQVLSGRLKLRRGRREA